MKNTVEVRSFVNGQLEENCYLIYVPGAREGLLIDPGSSPSEIIRNIDALGVRPVLILATHGHFDHVGAVKRIKERYQAPFYCPEADLGHLRFLGAEAPEPDRLLKGGEALEAGGLKVKVLATPGHTEGGLCYLLEEEGLLFSGDTLFEGTVGRSDLPGGSVQDLTRSLKQVLRPLKDGIRVYPGHGEATTMGREKKLNPYLRP